MDQAKYLVEAIQIIVNTRRLNADVCAIWAKLDRAAAYLNDQLAAELKMENGAS